MADSETIKQRLREKSTEELAAIYAQNDRSEWTDEAFVAIREVLGERGQSVSEPDQQTRIQLAVNFERPFSFASDGFGFVGKGRIVVDDGKVTLIGKKKWPFMARLGIFLAVTFLPLFLFGFGLGWLLAIIVVYSVCASPGRATFPVTGVNELKQDGAKVQFLVHSADDGPVRTCFRTMTNHEAVTLTTMLTRL